MPRVQTAFSVDLAEDDRRVGGERLPVNANSTVRGTDRMPRDVLVEDLSATGFRFRSPERFAIGSGLHLGLAGAGRAQARIVRVEADAYGCEFTVPLTTAQLAGAFSGGSVLTRDFAGTQTMTLLPYEDRRYPGAARLLVLAAGAALSWGAALAIGWRTLGWLTR